MKRLRRSIRYDGNVDPGFVQRVQAAFATAGHVEQTIAGAGTMSSADAARLRMLSRKGLLADSGSADAARQRMIQQHQRLEQ